MDFKGQMLKDLEIFHNSAEFASMADIWYNGRKYTLPVIIDHEAFTDRKRLADDHGVGLSQADARAYMSLADLGFLPKRGAMLEIEEAGAVRMYEIVRSSHEDGEIVLDLGAFEE